MSAKSEPERFWTITGVRLLVFAARKLTVAVIMLFVISLFVFVAFSLVPGDPAQQLLGHSWTPEAGAELRRKLGLDDPIPEQYVRFIRNALHGDLGRSYMTRLPVLSEITRAFLNSFQLAATAIAISLMMGVPIGVLASIKHNSSIDIGSRILTVILSSIPTFVLGILVIYVFAAKLHLLPSGGRGGLKHIVLPALTLSLFSMAGILRMTRASMLEVLRQGYIKAAMARGIAYRKVILRYGLRNAAIPLVTLGGLYAGTMIGTAVITEYVFAWPGLGTTAITAIQSRDIPLIQGSILAIAATYVTINSLLDISYMIIDPRLRTP